MRGVGCVVWLWVWVGDQGVWGVKVGWMRIPVLGAQGGAGWEGRSGCPSLGFFQTWNCEHLSQQLLCSYKILSGSHAPCPLDPHLEQSVHPLDAVSTPPGSHLEQSVHPLDPP